MSGQVLTAPFLSGLDHLPCSVICGVCMVPALVSVVAAVNQVHLPPGRAASSSPHGVLKATRGDKGRALS